MFVFGNSFIIYLLHSVAFCELSCALFRRVRYVFKKSIINTFVWSYDDAVAFRCEFSTLPECEQLTHNLPAGRICLP